MPVLYVLIFLFKGQDEFAGCSYSLKVFRRVQQFEMPRTQQSVGFLSSRENPVKLQLFVASQQLRLPYQTYSFQLVSSLFCY